VDIPASWPGNTLALCGKITDMSEYADYPGGENFEPWQDHGWPEHCGVPAAYFG